MRGTASRLMSISLVLLPVLAVAGGKKSLPPSPDQDQQQSQFLDVGGIVVKGPDVTASPSVTLQGATYEAQVPDTAFYYSPNYVSCLRTYGLQWAGSKGSASLGVPGRRDRSCDLWLAVHEARLNGHIALSYAFMCQIRNVRLVWGENECLARTSAAVASAAYETVAEGQGIAALRTELLGAIQAQGVEIAALRTALEAAKQEKAQAEAEHNRQIAAARRRIEAQAHELETTKAEVQAQVVLIEEKATAPTDDDLKQRLRVERAAWRERFSALLEEDG